MMLERLRIENLLLFSQSELIFTKGLNVISGESGAGKSVLLQALGLVLGSRADRDLIGPAGEEAYIEAVFDQKVNLFSELTQEDPVLARRLGKNQTRAFVSGRSCSAEMLSEGGSELIFLSGQHAAQKLANPAYQRELLDFFAGVDSDQLQDLYRAWQGLQKELEELRKKLLELQERSEFLEHEKNLIEELALEEGEEEALAAERERLIHADKLEEKIAFLRTLLLGEGESPLLESLARAKSEAEEISKYEQDAVELIRLLEEASFSLEAASDLARSMDKSYMANPSRLEEIEQRLFSLGDLRRRYKNMNISQITDHLGEISKELALLENGEEKLMNLEKATEKAKKEYFSLAKKVSERRKKGARQLERAVTLGLGDLALGEASFTVSLPEVEAGYFGLEGVEMLLSANRGIKAIPLGKGASGGELSRVHLALLLALPKKEGLTYVFDEIDAGIGGQTAHALANKLYDLSQKNQVIIVTHLAQIAALADNHLAIVKESSGKLSEAKITSLDLAKREEEIARLLGLQKEDASQAARLLAAARKK